MKTSDKPRIPEEENTAAQERGTFVNCSNHPSVKWSAEQRAEAEKYGPVMDLPFPEVPAGADIETVKEMADELVDQILQMNPAAVMCQGEFTLTFAIVRRLMKRDILCLSACAERDIAETVMPDGTTSKQSFFRFTRFRPYE